MKCERACFNGSTELQLSIEQPVITEENGGLRLSYKRHWGNAVTQFITVYSLPSNKTIYLTQLRANADSSVDLEPVFPVYVGLPPGFERQIVQYRSERWLNIDDRMAYISLNPLPQDIPNNRFYLSSPTKGLPVKEGEFFGRSGVLIVTGQSHSATMSMEKDVSFIETFSREKIGLGLHDTDTLTRFLIEVF